MARKRLSPAQSAFLGDAPAPSAAPPVAAVAGDASATAALSELSDEMTRLRAEGRIIVEIPTDEILPDHLVRDRVVIDAEEMRSLSKSIFDHGQRTPVEITELATPQGTHRYGLISGWRRLRAIETLHEQTGEPRFGTILAVLRRPKDSADAYVSMVEENEIRVGLSYYERARVAAEAAAAGVFETEKQALLTLFASASRAKRSRIRAFIEIYRHLHGVLQYPAAIPERLGLSLIEAMRNDPSVVPRLSMTLERFPPQAAEDELAAIAAVLEPVTLPAAPREKAREDVPRAEHLREELANGLKMELRGRVLKITGPQVDSALFEALRPFLEDI